MKTQSQTLGRQNSEILHKRERKDHRSQRDQGHYKKNYRFNKPGLIRTNRDKRQSASLQGTGLGALYICYSSVAWPPFVVLLTMEATATSDPFTGFGTLLIIVTLLSLNNREVLILIAI